MTGQNFHVTSARIERERKKWDSFFLTLALSFVTFLPLRLLHPQPRLPSLLTTSRHIKIQPSLLPSFSHEHNVKASGRKFTNPGAITVTWKKNYANMLETEHLVNQNTLSVDKIIENNLKYAFNIRVIVNTFQYWKYNFNAHMELFIKHKNTSTFFW